MADAKLTELTQVTTPADTDKLYLVQGTSSYYVTRSELLDVEDTPVNGNTTRPVSSNWAYDHENASDPHSVYGLLSAAESATGKWSFTVGLDVDGEVTEEVTALSGTSVALDPADGSIQTHDLTGNTTYTAGAGWSSGETLTLLVQVDDGASGSYTVTWPTIKWSGGTAPTLTASTAASDYDIVVLTKIGSVIYGQHAGAFSTPA
jgi:hypothetical protein